MTNEFAHSAEGTHWTKKNHKYIRKEGNRYIYPTDGNKLRRNTSMYNQNSPDYKAISTANRQRVNRENAANGGSVRNQEYAKQMTRVTHAPTATINGNKIKFGPSMDTMNRRTVRQKMQGSTDYKALSQQNVNKTAQRSAVSNQAGVNKDFVKGQNRRQAVNRQGSNAKGYNYAKEENNWRQYQPGTISAKRKKAMYLQGTGNGIWRDPQTADQAKNLNEYRSDFFGAKVQDYSRSVKANKGKEVVNKLKAKLGEISAKKDQLAKKAKDFFHRLSAKYDEKRYLSKMYDENSGRPKSYNKYEGLREASGTLGSTTGNAGGGNLRVGVEAGRRRAGIKKSGNVSGLENNLRNKGYNASTDANWDNSMDNFHGSYNKRGTRKLDGTSYNDLHATRQKHDNEAIRQNKDRYRTGGGSVSPDELTRGTKAGQQRVNRKKLRERYGR